MSQFGEISLPQLERLIWLMDNRAVSHSNIAWLIAWAEDRQENFIGTDEILDLLANSPLLESGERS